MFSSSEPFLHPSISASSTLLPAHLRLPPIMATRIPVSSAFYRPESCLLLPNYCDASPMHVIIKRVVIVFAWPILDSAPRSVWLCVQLFVRPAAQERSRAKWIKASFLSALWQDRGLFIAAFADRDVNVKLNKTSGLDDRANPPTHFFPKSKIPLNEVVWRFCCGCNVMYFLVLCGVTTLPFVSIFNS